MNFMMENGKCLYHTLMHTFMHSEKGKCFTK